MIDLSTFKKVKAFIREFAAGDARVKEFIAGPDERLLNAMSSSVIYPAFWVEDIEYRGTENKSLAFQYYWAITINIMKNALKGKKDQEDDALELCHQILSDFLAWLRSKARKGEILIDLSRFYADAIEGGPGKDNAHGWAFTVILGVHPRTICPPSGRYFTSTLVPVSVEGATAIGLNIEGRPYSVAWDGSSAGDALKAMVSAINNGNGDADIEASTDLDFLYLKGKAVGTSPAITLNQGPSDHNWLEPFKMN